MVLEALACNRPVVAQRDQIGEHVVGNAGLLCNCGDVNEYSETLQKAVKTGFGMLPRRRAEAFGMDVVGPLYEEALMDACSHALRSRLVDSRPLGRRHECRH